MVRVKKEVTRSDTTSPKKKSNRNKPEYKLYQKYLKSEKFKEVKDIVHLRDKEKCCCCGRDENLQVHHVTYEHLGLGGNIEANDCILLCRICHSAISRAKGNLNRWTDKSPILDNIRK